MEAENHYVKLNVEKYGGMLCAPWFDRPLSVAGRLAVKEGNRIATKLVKVDRDLLMIPTWPSILTVRSMRVISIMPR